LRPQLRQLLKPNRRKLASFARTSALEDVYGGPRAGHGAGSAAQNEICQPAEATGHQESTADAATGNRTS
jgi:hypothetical protein